MGISTVNVFHSGKTREKHRGASAAESGRREGNQNYVLADSVGDRKIAGGQHAGTPHLDDAASNIDLQSLDGIFEVGCPDDRGFRTICESE
ncbi:hypothetical protein [Neisseria elongata]|uniref:hypothetical protein n=1 Tax=Neisseria elongata TaxID=495 RepID=UPI00131B1C67|nr:hypothetical protein [Neisseria elongata]